MKKLLCVILISIMIISFSLSPSANVYGNAGSYCYSDYSGAYLVECSGSNANINSFSSVSRQSAQLKLSYRISAVCGFGGRFVFLCDDSVNNQLVVYTYDVTDDVLDSFCIYGAKLYNNIDFCCDESGFYIENNNDPKELIKYSFSGSYIKSFSFGSDITFAACGYSSGAYIVSGGSLFRISGDSFVSLSGTSVSTPVFAASDDYLISAYGNVYHISNSAEHVFDVDSDGKTNGACIIGNTLYCSSRSTVFGYDIETGEKTCYFNASISNAVLYAEGKSITAVDGSGRSIVIDTDDFTLIERDNGAGNSDTHPSIDARNQASAGIISSNVYDVSNDELIISKIPAGTTVAAFKSNMNYDGYSVSFYRDGSEKKSGNVGTAMTAVFSSDGASYTYELSVIGDLTGEGNCNSRDLNVLMDYLIGAVSFNGVYSLSADLSDDGNVDVIDLAMMKRSI